MVFSGYMPSSTIAKEQIYGYQEGGEWVELGDWGWHTIDMSHKIDN